MHTSGTHVSTTRRTLLVVTLATAGGLFVSGGAAESVARATPASVRATPSRRPPIERVVLERVGAFAEIGTAPLVGSERRRLSRNVAPAADPHAAGVACDRDLDARGVTAGARQILLDGARRLGAIPKFHYGPKRSRRGDSWGLAGDRGHFEWDPVALGYEPIPAIVAARLDGKRVSEPEP